MTSLSAAPRQHDVRRGLGRHVRRALVAQRREIEAVQQMLARPEQPGGDRDVHLVDHPSFEVLADRRDPAADLHVLSVRGFPRTRECLVGTTGDEVEHRAAFHLDRRAGVVRQDEHRHVVRRILPPPATPRVIGPGPADRAEHVATHDIGADAYEIPRGEFVVHARRAALLLHHALEGARWEIPLVQLFTTDAKRGLLSLVRSGAVAIERDREVVDAYASHRVLGAQGRSVEARVGGMRASGDVLTFPVAGSPPGWSCAAPRASRLPSAGPSSRTS